MSPVPPSSRELKRLATYIVNLKRWLRKEHAWQRVLRTEVNRLRRKVASSGDPAPITPPPPPPFRP
jgi:hypothetical protein